MNRESVRKSSFEREPGSRSLAAEKDHDRGLCLTEATGKTPIFRKASCACGGGCPSCAHTSGNIPVSQPSDPAEIEADRTAARIMRMPAQGSKSENSEVSHASGQSIQINRKCDTCDDEEATVQRKPAPSTGAGSQSPSSHVRDALSSGGHQLDAETRNFFEPRLGVDLEHVRVHTDSAASRSARAVDAKAYTLGSDLVFGQGEYHPTSESGKTLLAHELAHVAQQDGSPDVVRRKVVDEDKIHGPILDAFSEETGSPRDEASHHSKEYETWLADKHAGAEEFEKFTLEAKHLKIPQVTRRFERMTLEELYEYRQNYMFDEKGKKDPAVIKYLTDLMTGRPLQACSKEEIKKTDDLAKAIMKDVPAKVDNALKAVTKLLSLWASNKPELLARQSKFRGEVGCAFVSNFNVNETDSNFGTTAIRVERRLLSLQKRVAKPVSFSCEPINQKICLEAKGRDADGFVVSHKEPIHLCYGFREGIFGQEATIIHELLHLLPGLGDAGGYAALSTMARTCNQGLQFSATPDVLGNTADSITGFIMHIDGTSATDLKVVPF